MKLREIAEHQRPLIWDIVDQQLSKGARVLYHAHLTGEQNGYMVGLIKEVLRNHFVVIPAGSREHKWFPFGEHDDTDLMIRKSHNQDVADFTIQDNQ